MTITIGWSEVAAIMGFAVGILVVILGLILLVSFGHWNIHVPWLTPARAAGMRRFFKLLFYPVLGAVLSNAAVWVATLLINFHVGPDVANATGVVVGAMLGGARQGMTWTTEPPPPIVATNPPSFGQQMYETPTQ